MELRKFIKQLGRYQKGSTNETEKAIIEAWYDSYEAGGEKQLSVNERERVRNSMHSKISGSINKPVRSMWFGYGIAASILLLCSSAALVYFLTKPLSIVPETYTTLSTLNGEIRKVTLPDSSVVWINAQSQIRVPSNFDKTIRQVYLDEGEAFFEVKHNIHKPFRVITAPLQVQVLGTSFNINAYHSLSHVKITVVTGKVGVSKGTKLLSFLTPGQELSYLTDKGTFEQKKVDAGQSQSWKDGDTYLNRVKFEELALVFKNLYGLTLKAGNKRVHDYLFTLRIKRNTPATETLKLISAIHNAHFRKEGTNIIIY
ncbi:ferric-dicitrate binding protein FerR, regulates iron transport through sigma-19 [Mucilaginibacter gossypiicola]|uniref:Ferric-dicitrate binding protein FerR, regulates iron transport through sigma-19 n=1 Tax=Mucilaginibacter gossypiicola TaxID=551995 RepID=A0A1H7ZYL0_9SPHI|nr:FecR family protein [Mucilaginibacter gossypiicola]SEM62678.1 ferric-dicitrate binding protein FerR, regulates iron transport through sigma-19 [Mucilaginibacter gossypiicola]